MNDKSFDKDFVNINDNDAETKVDEYELEADRSTEEAPVEKSFPVLAVSLGIVFVVVIALLLVLAYVNKPEDNGNDVVLMETETEEISSDIVTEEITGTEETVETQTASSAEETTTKEIDETTEEDTVPELETFRYVPGFLDNREYEEVTDLIKEYYAYMNKIDADGINSIIYGDYNTYVGETVSADSLKTEMELIEEYKNIDVFIVKGIEKDSYICYTTFDIKFYGIDTLAPSLSRFFVMKNDEGAYRLYMGEMAPSIYAHVMASANSNSVRNLMEVIDTELYKAKKADSRLAELMNIIG